MSALWIAARLAVLALAVAVLAGPQILANRFGWRFGGRLPILVHRLFLALFGVRVSVLGAPPDPGRATLVISNHVSWLDVAVIGSLAPLSFIAKSEIAGWPVFGTLARLQRCVFIDRSRRGATADTNALVAERLAAGDLIVLFAEGTTGDGSILLPFRSSLVGAAKAALAHAADGGAVALQPLAIAYLRRSGLPVTRRERPEIAWYGDMDLVPHLRAFLRGGALDVVAVWGEPIAFDALTDRKRVTAAAEGQVRRAIAQVRAGGTPAIRSTTDPPAQAPSGRSPATALPLRDRTAYGRIRHDLSREQDAAGP